MDIKSGVLAITILGAAGAMALGGIALAKDRGADGAHKGPMLSRDEAVQRVVKEYPGKVVETELEREHGRKAWKVRIKDEQGTIKTRYVDAATGKSVAARTTHYEEDDDD